MDEHGYLSSSPAELQTPLCCRHLRMHVNLGMNLYNGCAFVNAHMCMCACHPLCACVCATQVPRACGGLPLRVQHGARVLRRHGSRRRGPPAYERDHVRGCTAHRINGKEKTSPQGSFFRVVCLWRFNFSPKNRFVQNESPSSAGALALLQASAAVSVCEFWDNRARQSGGASNWNACLCVCVLRVCGRESRCTSRIGVPPPS